MKTAKVTPPPTQLRIDLTVRSAIVAMGGLAFVWLLLQLWQVLLVVVVGLMLVGMLNPFVERLEGRGLRRGSAIAVIFGTMFVVMGGLSALAVPRLVTQGRELIEHFPESQARLAAQLESSSLTAPAAGWVRSQKLAALADGAKEYVVAYGPKVFEVIAYAVSASFLALYLLIDRDRMRGALFSIVPRRAHVRLSRVLINLEIIVGGYMRGQAITSALMAGFTFIVLTIAGVPNAVALALFAGVADVLPYIGALLSCGPAFVGAMSKGTTVAFVVLGVLAAYQEFESRVIVPRIYGKVLRLPAATVMIALLVGGKLLGILGALLALPIAAGMRMAIEELRVALPGDHVVDPDVRRKDAAAEAEFEMRAAGVPAAEAAAIATEISEDRRVDETPPASSVAVVVIKPGSDLP